MKNLLSTITGIPGQSVQALFTENNDNCCSLFFLLLLNSVLDEKKIKTHKKLKRAVLSKTIQNNVQIDIGFFFK